MPDTISGALSSFAVPVKRVVKPKNEKSIHVYKNAGNTSRIIGFLKDKAAADKYRNGYYHIPSKDGWVLASLVTIENDYSPNVTIPVSKEEQKQQLEEAAKIAAEQATAAANRLTTSQQKKIYLEYVNTEYGDLQNTDGTADSLLLDNLNGVYGIPYQFPNSVDPKLDNTQFGAIYADRIISRIPLLIMSPGKVDFMSSYSDGEKNAVFDALLGSDGADATTLGGFLSKPGKYYTFEYDAATYWKYVNGMNHACAIYLGIGDVSVNINGYSNPLRTFKWEKATNSKFDSLLISNQDYVCFYTDADSTIDNSFSNSTTESQLASKVNSFSDIAKEVTFLVGTQTGKKLEWLSEEGISDINKKLSGFADKLLNGSEVFKSVGREFSVIATGGKLIFPEIWSDSTFSQSFDIKIKLRCPCPNKLSWYLDICVPLNHLIAFTMPRTPRGKDILDKDYEPSANGYMSPFLVRAFYRGLFNCDMGIVTDLSIQKGKEGSWTVDGLPSEVDVSMTIKDLYNVMAMTAEDQEKEFINNTTYLNYLANSCGISINKPDIQRSLDLWLMFKENTWKNRLTGYNWWQSAKQGTMNKIFSLYSGIFKG